MALLTETLKQSSCLPWQGDFTAGAHSSTGELKEICWLSFRAATVVKNKLKAARTLLIEDLPVMQISSSQNSLKYYACLRLCKLQRYFTY